MKKLKLFSVLVIIGLFSTALFTSCDDNDDDPNDGNLTIIVDVNVDGLALELDTMKYQNAAGNMYDVRRFKMALSRIMAVNSNGAEINLKNEHLVDITNPASLSLASATVAGGDYTNIKFIFGLDEIMNVAGAYPDPPFNAFEWPMMLGGGYHYMQLDGFYNGATGMDPYNTHAGPTNGNQNYISFDFPVIFKVDGGTTTATIDVNINNFYNGLNMWDFSVVPTAIMPDQSWQAKLKENAQDVFSVSVN